MRSADDDSRQRWIWLALAVLLFTLITAQRYAAFFEVGLREAIPSQSKGAPNPLFVRPDQRFVVWAVSRNARTLATRPLGIFDAEQCFPAKNSLALGEPVIAMGVLGIPVWLVSQDPVLTYNVVLLLMSMCAALAMYWLIREWTGVPAAGIVAGLLYAFHALAIQNVLHPYSSDTTWMVLALLFAKRLFSSGRWIDALGLAASASMQMATSFYSFVAAGLIGLAFVIDLAIRHRLRGVRPVQLLAVGAVMLASGLMLFAPYIQLQATGILEERSVQHFRAWSDYLPGGHAFFGWWAGLLALAGLVIPARHSLARTLGDVRFGLMCGGLLVAILASGPSGLAGIDLYSLLAALAPGFDSVRVPFKIAIGVHLVASVLAGIGAAGLIRRWHWKGQWLGALLLIAITFVNVSTGLRYADQSMFHLRPAEEETHFFEQLAELGNAGPVYETPMPPGDRAVAWMVGSRQLLLSAFHHRPTSGCYPSHVPLHQKELDDIESRLPEPSAIRQLRDLGFTTILLHHPRGLLVRREAHRVQLERGRRFSDLAQSEDGPLRMVHESRWVTAYEIDP